MSNVASRKWTYINDMFSREPAELLVKHLSSGFDVKIVSRPFRSPMRGMVTQYVVYTRVKPNTRKGTVTRVSRKR